MQILAHLNLITTYLKNKGKGKLMEGYVGLKPFQSYNYNRIH
jgi:hypothetical protein